MLPKFDSESSSVFVQALSKFQDQVMAKDLDIMALQKTFAEVQSIYQDQMFAVPPEALDPGLLSTWQSTQTEIYRTLRLLGTDLLFLQSSRQRGTLEQRLGIVRDRLDQLIGYSQAIGIK
ncbi:heterocyst frequency control protein PatD [Aphanothece sacrum]|uniref:Glucose-6-phosphatase n=1 Tax=Aphanothece sacrum FPU1 TaxID=1920663 RepID=A0A401IJY7_APHSA|nr:heterocyst frequency control protein PatD [Aphanothece sacrum]GBF81608.1 glucose-6-phosphatase [Aphanothece sacrum FPU1]GBF84134.1 glucose-6-phosphatase [Aphanothece sacrum FPU3]